MWVPKRSQKCLSFLESEQSRARCTLADDIAVFEDFQFMFRRHNDIEFHVDGHLSDGSTLALLVRA